MFSKSDLKNRIWKHVSCLMLVSCAISPASLKADDVATVASQPTAQQTLQGLDEKFLSKEQMDERKRVLDAAKLALEARMAFIKNGINTEDNNVDNKKILSVDAIQRLIRIYEQMPPREAAPIFNVMDQHVLVAISANMNTRKLAAVMALMNPDRVNMVTQYIVGVRHFKHSDANTSFVIPISKQDQVNLINSSMGPAQNFMPSRQ